MGDLIEIIRSLNLNGKILSKQELIDRCTPNSPPESGIENIYVDCPGAYAPSEFYKLNELELRKLQEEANGIHR
jgi:hypothetical protein